MLFLLFWWKIWIPWPLKHRETNLCASMWSIYNDTSNWSMSKNECSHGKSPLGWWKFQQAIIRKVYAILKNYFFFGHHFWKSNKIHENKEILKQSYKCSFFLKFDMEWPSKYCKYLWATKWDKIFVLSGEKYS